MKRLASLLMIVCLIGCEISWRTSVKSRPATDDKPFVPEALTEEEAIDREIERAMIATEKQIEREAQILMLRGDAYMGLGKWDEALKRWERLLQIKPQDKWALAMKKECLFQLKEEGKRK